MPQDPHFRAMLQDIHGWLDRCIQDPSTDGVKAFDPRKDGRSMYIKKGQIGWDREGNPLRGIYVGARFDVDMSGVSAAARQAYVDDFRNLQVMLASNMARNHENLVFDVQMDIRGEGVSRLGAYWSSELNGATYRLPSENQVPRIPWRVVGQYRAPGETTFLLGPGGSRVDNIVTDARFGPQHGQFQVAAHELFHSMGIAGTGRPQGGREPAVEFYRTNARQRSTYDPARQRNSHFNFMDAVTVGRGVSGRYDVKSWNQTTDPADPTSPVNGSLDRNQLRELLGGFCP